MAPKTAVLKDDSTLTQRPTTKLSAPDSASAKTTGASNILESPPKIKANWTPPTLSLKEVRDAIPPHCFKRSLWKSFSYVLADLAGVAILVFFAVSIDSYFAKLHPALPYLLWPVYWFCQGVVCTGLWVLAHECGHQAFSDYGWVNNTVGYIIHTALLVPYFSWKFSHSKHHKATNHMDKDQVFVPSLRSEVVPPSKQKQEFDDEDDEGILGHAPLSQVRHLLIMLLLGWPAYLIYNASGQRYSVWTSHFRPDSPIFDAKQYFQIIQSDLGVFSVLGLIVYFSYTYSFAAVAKYYIIPYLWVNFWLVLITYLQHTDVKVPHYRDREFNFLRGSLSTVDRDYGILNHFFHHIGDTHVVHHFFSQMPHYNAEEATEAVKKVLGDYYVFDSTNIFVAAWKSTHNCKFVEDTGDVLWYKH